MNKNNYSERISKFAVFKYLKALFWNSRREGEETYDDPTVRTNGLLRAKSRSGDPSAIRLLKNVTTV
jgi:hypothetical protein